jgi:hypothetical protein
MYIDASQSMAGFVGCRGATTEFDATVDRLANDLGIADVTMFGEGRGAMLQQRPLDAAVHCPDAYRQVRNPDFALYQAIRSDSSSGVHLYVTDGVQSASTAATPSPSVAALQQWISEGKGLAILAFRSRFSGPLWSEQASRWLGRAEAAARPFYVIVLAPSDAAVDAVIARLSPSLKQHATEMRFSGPGTDCDVRRKASQIVDAKSDPVWMFIGSAQRAQGSGGALPLAEMRCAIAPSAAIGEVGARLVVDYHPFRGGSFGPSGPVPAGTQFQASSTGAVPDTSVVLVSASVPPKQPGTRFGFYQVRMTPVPGLLKPAITELSTESDAAVSSAGSTYRFAWMVEHLARSQFERTATPQSFFLTLQNVE